MSFENDVFVVINVRLFKKYYDIKIKSGTGEERSYDKILAKLM